ncbi:hypothetical protein L873DRAFT_1814261 [Choiromyces venosus 120613-1]|uniref:Uncharacterized protein n=1 Tax=Choiromyces venosus 120613-1 TaxID=1336337 RepID=A0A3N4JDE3_9PEZI|nr:hypothetical protein L873DRAFT_1814261 [Choiromyces venosus 120613-1]
MSFPTLFSDSESALNELDLPPNIVPAMVLNESEEEVVCDNLDEGQRAEEGEDKDKQD